jgi:3-hydroxyacyl-[acyl-carrier-protein] dehydratase
MNDQILPGPVEAAKILEYLPHRYPFLLIDRVLSLVMEPEKRLTGIKNVTINEPFFQGHFPGNPVMPGVLMIEAMAQAAGMLARLAAETEGRKGELYYLVKVDKAKFNRIVVPGDQILLDVIQKRIMRGMGQYECSASVEGRRVASCEILCAGRKE